MVAHVYVVAGPESRRQLLPVRHRTPVRERAEPAAGGCVDHRDVRGPAPRRHAGLHRGNRLDERLWDDVHGASVLAAVNAVSTAAAVSRLGNTSSGARHRNACRRMIARVRGPDAAVAAISRTNAVRTCW